MIIIHLHECIEKKDNFDSTIIQFGIQLSGSVIIKKTERRVEGGEKHDFKMEAILITVGKTNRVLYK